MWESEDLLHWSRQKLLKLGDENFGCLWAPDVVYDPKNKDYVLHWSSSYADKPYMGIYFSRTKDFQTFTQPKLLYEKPDAGIIDSAIYGENGRFYLFVKCDHDPEHILLLCSENVEGPYERIGAFDRSMKAIEPGLYEGPTAVQLENGKWCLFLDYYGAEGDGQGYVPFVADSLASGEFLRSDREFSFPYGYKHGTVIPISEEEYNAIKQHDWTLRDWQ